MCYQDMIRVREITHSLATWRTVSSFPPRTSTACSEYSCEILRRMVCACMHCLGSIYSRHWMTTESRVYVDMPTCNPSCFVNLWERSCSLMPPPFVNYTTSVNLKKWLRRDIQKHRVFSWRAGWGRFICTFGRVAYFLNGLLPSRSANARRAAGNTSAPRTRTPSCKSCGQQR
jgi:hypothetical protein